MFILTTDLKLWTCELMCRIMSCNHSLGLKEFLDQLNLLYIFGYIYTYNRLRVMSMQVNELHYGLRHSLQRKDILKFVYYFMILFLTVYIFKYFFIISTI
jgi:hypothetical protein